MTELAFAITKSIRIPPRKARLAATLIRNQAVDKALAQLELSLLKGARFLKKTLLSAISNAETVHDMNRSALVVREVRIDAGPTLKRAKSRNKGGRMPVMKRTSHFYVAVGAQEE